MKPVKGFTLIELVVVIVILGILAATALPKFVDLGKDARIAKVNAMAGALKSAATQGRSICAIVGGTLCPTNSAVVFNYQGKSYNFVMGYPEAGNYLNGGQIDSFVDTTGFTLSLSASTDATRFSVTDAPDPANCWANYEQAWDVNTGPKITTETKGCGNS